MGGGEGTDRGQVVRLQGAADDGERAAAGAAAQVDAGQSEQQLAEVAWRVLGCLGGRGGFCGGEQSVGAGKLGVDVAGGEEAVMANLDEAFGQDVQDEATEKLLGRQSDFGVAASAERDAAVIERDEAMVADADPVGILAEVAEDLLLVAEGRFAIDDPSASSEPFAQAVKGLGVSVGGGGPGEAELSPLVGELEDVEQLVAKACTEDAHGNEVVERSGDPAGAVERQAPCGNDTVDMGVKPQVASPRVQDAGDGELGAEMARIAPELEQRGGGASKESVEDEIGIDQRESAQLPGQGEDDVKGVGGQHARHALCDPAGLVERLALWTVPVATRVVGELLDVAARGAHVLVAAELGRPAASNVAQDGLLLRRQSVSACEVLAVSTDDVRDLQQRLRRRAHARRGAAVAVHGALAEHLGGPRSAEHVNGALHARRVRGRDAGVAQSRADGAMPQKHLDDTDIGAKLQEVCPERMA
jgi:hypothetical protein